MLPDAVHVLRSGVKQLVARAYLRLKRKAFLGLLARYWLERVQYMRWWRRQQQLQMAKRAITSATVPDIELKVRTTYDRLETQG